MHAIELETYNLTKRFGAFTALDSVSLKVRPGTVHALLGENGAGKSTLVKCVVGYYRPDDGAVMVEGREQDIHSPTIARDLGIGMVYQHFTVVPGMTVAENLLLARGHLPAVIDWKAVRRELDAFMQTTPFKLPLDATPLDLAAGEKQKLEILKQLFLKPRLLILDEPTSVLTPQEADEVLGALRDRAHAMDCSVVMITHKFREVMEHADDVSVLRRGKLVDTGAVADTSPQRLAAAMVGEAKGAATANLARAALSAGPVALAIDRLEVMGDRGELAVRGLSLDVRAGEIVGVAGVSGNGQRELMQSLTGQRARESGGVKVGTRAFSATRRQNRELKVRSLPKSRSPTPASARSASRTTWACAPSTKRRSPAPAGSRGAASGAARANGSSPTASRRRASARRSARSPAATCSARCWRANSMAKPRCCSSRIRSSASTSPPSPRSTRG